MDRYTGYKRAYRKLPFTKFLFDHYSQTGEDGVIQEILVRLKMLNNPQNYCVEFGAWDGKHLSNTFRLVERYRWQAVYIEGNSDRYRDLCHTAVDFPNIVPIHAMVDFNKESSNTLDNILGKTSLPRNFALLSIDIDSWDLSVWDSLTLYEPCIVVIEIDSNIRPGIRKSHSKMSPGSSFTSTLEVGLNKGYRLVCHTGNMIFVREQYLRHLDIDQRFIREPELLFTYHLTWLRSWITWNLTDWLYRRPFHYNKILTLFCYWTIFKCKLVVRRFRVAKSHTQGNLL